MVLSTNPLVNGINELFAELKDHTRGGTVLFADEIQCECMAWNASLESLMKNGALTLMDLHQPSTWISNEALQYLFELKKNQKPFKDIKPIIEDTKKHKKIQEEEDDEEFEKMFSDEEDNPTILDHEIETESEEEIEQDNTLSGPIKALFFVGTLNPRNERAIKKAVHTYRFEHVVVLCSHSDSFAQFYQRESNENYLTFEDLQEKITLWTKEAQMIKLKDKFNEDTFEP